MGMLPIYVAQSYSTGTQNFYYSVEKKRSDITTWQVLPIQF